jgi:hypothetical protein
MLIVLEDDELPSGAAAGGNKRRRIGDHFVPICSPAVEMMSILKPVNPENAFDPVASESPPPIR